MHLQRGCDWMNLGLLRLQVLPGLIKAQRRPMAEGQERLLLEFVKMAKQNFGRAVKLSRPLLCWNPDFVPLMLLISSPHGRVPGSDRCLIFLPLLAAGPPLCSPSGCLIKGALSNEITPWGLMVWLIDRHTARED